MWYIRCTVLCALLICHVLPAQRLFPKQENNLFGYIDTTGAWVISPQFHQAGFYRDMKAIASRNDSLFLVLKKDEILYLPDLKNYNDLGGGKTAIQNKEGKWAVADAAFRPLTPYAYNSIRLLDSMYLVTRNRLYGLVSPGRREVIPCSYLGITRFPNGQFKARMKDAENIFEWQNDSMELIMQHVNVIFRPEYRNMYLSYNKNNKTTVILNLKGDSVYGCTRCSVVRGFDNYVFIKDNHSVLMLDLKNKRIRDRFNDENDIVVENRRPGFLYIRPVRHVYVSGPEEPVIRGDSLHVDSVMYMDRKHLYVKIKGYWGIFDYTGKSILPCLFSRIDLIDSVFAEAYRNGYKEIYYMPLYKQVLKVSVNTIVTRDESSILVYNPGTASKLYAINERMDFTDSAEFRSLVKVHAGRKVQVNSTTNITPMWQLNAANIANPDQNVNTSACTRWFIRGRFYGLKGFNEDTLIRPRFTSVFRINDSMDIVVQKTSERTLRYIAGAGDCNVNTLYGVLNNRTGRFIVPPQYYFIDSRPFAERSSGVARVILRNGNFALIDITSFRIIPGTECTFITESREGLMRLFYQARFTAYSNEIRGKVSKVPQWLAGISGFWPYGPTEFSNYSNSVYVSSAAVNIADSTGRLLLDPAISVSLSYIGDQKDRNFIAVDQKNAFGVVSPDKGIIIQCRYNFIQRLPHDKRYFILQSFNQKYGYVNTSGTEISEAIFQNARNFSDDHAWCTLGDSMNIIDKNGNILPTGIKNGQVGSITEGLTSYRHRKGWVLIDINGDEITDERFKRIRPFLNGYASAQYKSGWGLINSQGEWIVEPQYEAIEAENNQAVIFSQGRNYYIYSRQGILLNKIRKKGHARTLGDHYFVIERGGFSKVYGMNGEPFLKRKLRQDLSCLNDTLMTVSNSRVVMYNPAGKRIARLQHKGGSRAINKGWLEMERSRDRLVVKLKVPKSFRHLHKDIFSDSTEKIVLVKPLGNSGMGLVDQQMHECIKYNAFIYQFDVNGSKLFCLSDSMGNLLSDMYYMRMIYYGNGLFKATYRNQNGISVSGILNHYGLWVVEPKFHDIQPFHSNMAIYSKHSDFWIADENGQKISDEQLVDYTYHDAYYCFRTTDKTAWWHPSKGWLSSFSK